MKHKCPVKSCAAIVPGSKLMCPQHWAMVPAPLAKAVYDTYRQHRHRLPHYNAMILAVNAVELQLRHP